MHKACIVAAGRVIDGQGSLQSVEAIERQLIAADVQHVSLTIDPLEAGWDTPVAPGHFRSGCAPIEAIASAQEMIASGQSRAVVIQGRDMLRTDYQHDKALRARRMAIYGEDCSIPQAYTQLAQAFMIRHDISEKTFLELASALYENYVRTASMRGRYIRPSQERFELVTSLFRSVDCANPVVDFTGRLIVLEQNLADTLNIPSAMQLQIAGVGLAQTSGDGPSHISQIARYDHLQQASHQASVQAGVDIAALFRADQALLEVYTCFPVVPIAFLLATGIAPDVQSISGILATQALTITGGMNIARGAWNNPALNGLIAMYETLTDATQKFGIVHGNGGLGYRQGVAILQKR